MKVLEKWNSKSVEEFQQECAQNGDLLLKPWDEQQEKDFQEKTAIGQKNNKIFVKCMTNSLKPMSKLTLRD